MSAHPNPVPVAAPRDPLDAMLRGRNAQAPFFRWLFDRVVGACRR